VKTDDKCRIGASGWTYKEWSSTFYPPKLPTNRWLEYYAEHFDTVEINGSFYRLPSAETFAAWKERAPENFIFAVKASRFLTHVKKLKDPEEPIERLTSRCRKLGDRLGPILYQLPPRWKLDIDRLRAFVEMLPRDLTHVLEFREQSWFAGPVRELMEEHKIGFCVHDMPDLDCPDWVTAPPVYIRFHGPTKTKYTGSYPDELLARWAQRIRGYRSSGYPVFAYFNNDIGGHAIENARTLIRLVTEE
jgi:uncharacterized protein YecE (DUF72 family)